MAFFDPGLDLKPRDEVKIEQLEIEPYPDRFRVFIHIRVTPFQERPNLLLSARDEHDRLVSEMSVIETMHHDMEFTMHLRNVEDPTGLYTLTATLFYESKNPPQDEVVEAFEIPPAGDEEANG
ncbi:MAG: hypothetical protein DIU68_000595 [Chloroflexota bacterium]|nr:MAG: hypothetical protein DIU68_15350 [Chloroflexota bacterium]